MTHITSWIVALTLTGSPVTTALCPTVCEHESAPTAHCHESLTDPAPTAMSGEATCVAATSDVSYIKEDVAASQVVAIPATMPLAPVATTFTPLGHVVDFPVVTGWLAPPLVLRI